MKTDAKNNRLPEFIQDRLNFFVRDLIQSNNNGPISDNKCDIHGKV